MQGFLIYNNASAHGNALNPGEETKLKPLSYYPSLNKVKKVAITLKAAFNPLTPSVLYIKHLRTKEPVRKHRKNNERTKEKNSGIKRSRQTYHGQILNSTSITVMSLADKEFLRGSFDKTY